MLFGSLFLLLIPLLPIAPDENPLFDRYSTSISIKQEHERLDNYAIQLKNSPGSRALIIVYAENEKTAASVKARARRAVEYLVKTRGLNRVRVVWRYDGACKQNEILLYLLFPNEVDPSPDTKCLRA